MRIFVDTQSNPLFRGSELEQAYGLRGGLCEGGEQDVVVVSNPFDKEYLSYWEGLGFNLPTIFVTENGQPNLTLSQLIMKDPVTSDALRTIASGNDAARLEFFCIEETERDLARHLNIPAYCNFNFSFKFAKKPNFRRFCLEHGIPVVEGRCCSRFFEAEQVIADLHSRGLGAIVKSESGTGGVACGGIIEIDPGEDIQSKLREIKFLGDEFVVEKVIRGGDIKEISIHWEILVDRSARIIGIQDQLATNFGYSGVTIPVDLPEKQVLYVRKTVLEIIIPAMIELGAVGFFSCDVILSPEEHWMDFNPRKGAALYIRQMIGRLGDMHFSGQQLFVWHEHVNLKKGTSFQRVRQVFGDLLVPLNDKQRLIVITNSGVLPFGFLDITAISTVSKEDARSHFQETRVLIFDS